VRLVYFKKIYATRYMTPVSIDCSAEGGHPDPEYFRSWAKPKATAKKVVFAGSVKVPEGKSKPLR
jgi:hypothetical protein